jgi:hypothetical protein
MHGFTTFEQSKTLFEKGYRHPKPIRFESTIGGRGSDQNFGFFSPEQYPSFSLADLVTMVGICPYMEDATGDMMIEILLPSLTISATLEQIRQSNQRLKEVYANN